MNIASSIARAGGTARATAATWALAALAIFSLGLAPAGAAAPGGSTGATGSALGSAQAGLVDGPPTLTNFRINDGAATTSDPSLRLSWTWSGRAPTHWRVATSPAFPNTPWNPVPLALPFKWRLEPATDGSHTVYMQLMNDKGQSEVRSAQIRYDESPRVTSVGVVSVGDPKQPYLVRVSVTASGRVDRWRVTQSPTIDFKEWTPVAAGAPLETTHWVTGTPAGATATLWVHVRRDNVGQHAASQSFALAVPRSDYEWAGNLVLDVMRSTHRLAVTKLTAGGGECAHSVASGWAHTLAATSPAGPVRCRFTLLNGTSLGFAWALKSAAVSFGDGTGRPPVPRFMRPGSECAIKELVTGGKAPRLAIEVYFPGGSSPSDAGGSTYCQLDRMTLTGPTGLPLNADTLERQALTRSPAQFPNDP